LHPDAAPLPPDAQLRPHRARRLRSQLTRTAEWASLDERTRVAALYDAAGPHARLVAALRSRHCAELRKGDLMELCRLWNYRSDIWSRRKDRQYVRRAGELRTGPAGAPEPPGQQLAALAPQRSAEGCALLPSSFALQPASQQVRPRRPTVMHERSRHALPPPRLLTRIAAARAPAQLAMVHEELAGPLRALSERSVAAFAMNEYPERLLALVAAAGGGTRLPPSAAAYLPEFTEHSMRQLEGARRGLQSMAGALTQQREGIQCTLLRLRPEERARPAWRALGGTEPPWDALLRDSAALCRSAINCCAVLPSPSSTAGTPPREDAASGCCGSSGGSPVADEADAQALQALTLSCASTISTAGGHALEMVTHVGSMLAQLKLAPYEVYLAAVDLLLGLLQGHKAAVAEALGKQLSTYQALHGSFLAAPAAGGMLAPGQLAVA
jgi:hypothetical protein